MAAPMIAKELQASIRFALAEAKRMRHEYLTVEHLLLALLKDGRTREVLKACGAEPKKLQESLESFLEETVEQLPDGVDSEPQQTIGVERVLFGSDWPHGEGLAAPSDFLKELHAFSDGEIRAVMRDNALALLGNGVGS